MTWWNVLESSITCESGWRFRLNSALPWPDGGNEFTWHNRSIKAFNFQDFGKFSVHFNFLSPFRRLFVLSVTSFFLWKWPWMGRSAWLRGWGKTENDEEQVSRTDLASKDSVLHTVEIIPGNNDVECITYCFLSFPVITIAVTYRCMLQCLGEQCIKWWNATKLKLCEQRKRSLHHRSSPSDSPASDQGKHQGYLTGCSTTWVLKKQSEWTSGKGIYGKMLNRLNEIRNEVQMTLLKLYLLENQQ